ncbi:MAG: hypothetical protein OHK0053_29210 [Microscillaceae bacterium]
MQWQRWCLFLVFFSAEALPAQELICNVIVDSKQLITDQTAERSLFDELQKAINGFLNNQKWTNAEFKKGEQINCNLVITLTESPVQNVFRATAQIQSTRPIYNTNYESNLLSFIDRDFNFRYTPGQPLIFSPTTFTNNLTSMLAFYAYVVLAMDFDSFSETGGNPYIEQAFNIVNIAESSGETGWRRNQGNRNRYWLAENLNSQQMLPFRKGLYQYHRLGMDYFLIDPGKARQEILKALEGILETNKLKPSAVLTNIFFDAKNQELVNIFREASEEARQQIHRIATQLDPTNTEKYNQLLKPR